jgi:hypothetical protein
MSFVFSVSYLFETFYLSLLSVNLSAYLQRGLQGHVLLLRSFLVCTLSIGQVSSDSAL